LLLVLLLHAVVTRIDADVRILKNDKLVDTKILQRLIIKR